MDIEERAEKWAREYMRSDEYNTTSYLNDIVAAYLAGSAQTQRDYSEHYADVSRETGHETDRSPSPVSRETGDHAKSPGGNYGYRLSCGHEHPAGPEELPRGRTVLCGCGKTAIVTERLTKLGNG